MEKREIWDILGRFEQVWASLGMFGQVWVCLCKLGQVWRRQQFRKMGKKAERIKKENKNLSGDREGGGESRV